jgi:chromosomal replication initiator protein
MDEKDEIDDVLEVVAGYYGVPRDVIRSASRAQDVHRARCIAMFLAHRIGSDARDIGQRLGGRDYTIVLDVCRKISSRVRCDADDAKLLRDLQLACEKATRKRNWIKFGRLH